MRTTEAAVPARGFLREWWPELLCAGLLVLIAFAGQRDDVLFSVFCAIIGGIFWAIGYRHRSLSLHRKVDEMTDGVGEMLTELCRDRDDVPPAAPQLHLVRNGDVS